MTLGIVVALPEELSTLSSVRLARGEVLAIHPSIKVCLSGAGHNNACKAAQTLINQGATKLISWGCAAALDPQLKPGDLIIANQVITQNGTIASPYPWIKDIEALVPKQLPVSYTQLASHFGLISSTSDKARLYAETSAAALDMESAGVAATAKDANLPFIAIRAIADPSAMSLPNAISKALNPDGKVELSVLLRHIIVHPLEIFALIKLGLHFQAARKTLTKVAGSITQFAS